MATYLVTKNGVPMATYREFVDAGHKGVRGLDLRSGRSEQYARRSAHSLALDTADRLAHADERARVLVLRDDGTIAADIRGTIAR